MSEVFASNQIIEEVVEELRKGAPDLYDLATNILNKLEELGVVKDINERLKDKE